VGPEHHALLVIDDEPETLKAIHRELRGRCHVYTALGAEEGARVLGEHPIQLVISDERMPGTTGTELLARFARSHPDTARVLMTGYSDLGAVTRAINEGGVYHYLTKPWDPAELLAVVEEGFQRHDLAAERRRRVAELDVQVSALEEANARLTRQNQAMDERLGVAAHELRTPAGTIQGFASLLLGGDDAPERRRRYLERIERSACTIGRLVGDLLDTTALEHGEATLRLEDADLGGLIASTAAALEARARAKQIAIVLDVAPELPRVRCDPARIEQVVDNLLGNALKFSPPDTTVTVRARRLDDAAQVSVEDRGPGIRPEDVGSLFARFGRASAKPTGGEKSTGLGLWICKQIIERHGGAITAENQPGGGARFSFTLPLGGPRGHGSCP
jgi:signal transduction histidine kinase